MHAIVIPAIFGFFIKLYLVFVNRFSLSRDKSVFTGLLSACTLHSLCEAIGYSLWAAGNDVTALYRLYYVLSVWVLCFMLLYALEVSTKAKWAAYAFIGFATTISAALLFTDFLISGYVDNEGILNSAKSENYWLFKVYAFSVIIISLSVLIRKILTSKEKTKALYVLVALIAPFLITISVIIMVHLGLRINSMAVVPVATTFMFVFIVMSENQHFLTDIKRSLPWSIESRAAAEYNLIQSKLMKGDISMKNATDEFQKIALKYQKHLTNKNISQMSRALKMSRSSVYQKMKDLDIN